MFFYLEEIGELKKVNLQYTVTEEFSCIKQYVLRELLSVMFL